MFGLSVIREVRYNIAIRCRRHRPRYEQVSKLRLIRELDKSEVKRK